jgi:ribosome biogenesis GTPase
MHAAHNDKFDQGVVIKKSMRGYQVHLGDRSVSCRLSPRLFRPAGVESDRNRFEQGTAGHHDSVAVGDMVRIVELNQDVAQIVEVLPRRNHLARRAAASRLGAYANEQVIAANLDQVVLVFAVASPAPRWRLLDRYLVAAEAAGLLALVCITKLDLAQKAGDLIDTALADKVQEYRRIGYRVQLVSAHTGAHLVDLKAELQGRISLLLGKSGVGKTTLLNALQPGLGLRVNRVSRATGKGRHTTTHLEMFSFTFGGAVIDTPGTREFGLWDIESEDLAYFFPEMRPFIGRCKFGLDCQHDEEPGCAVRRAVMAGQISPTRYQSYMVLKDDP